MTPEITSHSRKSLLNAIRATRASRTLRRLSRVLAASVRLYSPDPTWRQGQPEYNEAVVSVCCLDTRPKLPGVEFQQIARADGDQTAVRCL